MSGLPPPKGDTQVLEHRDEFAGGLSFVPAVVLDDEIGQIVEGGALGPEHPGARPFKLGNELARPREGLLPVRGL